MLPSLQRSPAVISFDIDGTLVDVWAVIDAALEQVCLELERISGAPVSLEALKALREAVAREADFANASAVDIRVESFRRAQAQAGLDPNLHLERVTEVFFARRFGEYAFYPDVLPALQGLRQRGKILVTASNGNSYLEHTPYAAFFEQYFFAEQLGCKKPSPAFFEAMARRCGQSAERICHVGDSLVEDYRPARASGMLAVLVQRSPELVPEDVVAVASLAELLSMVCSS